MNECPLSGISEQIIEEEGNFAYPLIDILIFHNNMTFQACKFFPYDDFEPLIIQTPLNSPLPYLIYSMQTVTTHRRKNRALFGKSTKMNKFQCRANNHISNTFKNTWVTYYMGAGLTWFISI